MARVSGAQRGGRGHVPQRAHRPLAGGNRACASVWRLSQRLGRDRRQRGAVRKDDPVRPGERGRCRGRDRRAGSRVPYVPPVGFWRSVRQACDEFGALLIFDEIPTGLGKTGKMFACEHDGVVPDMLVIGKSLGGGVLPIAALICRPELDVCGSHAFGHYTHEKNPVTTRAGLTTLQIIEEEHLVESAARVGDVGLSLLQEMMDRHPLIGDVRGRGCLLAPSLFSTATVVPPRPMRPTPCSTRHLAAV